MSTNSLKFRYPTLFVLLFFSTFHSFSQTKIESWNVKSVLVSGISDTKLNKKIRSLFYSTKDSIDAVQKKTLAIQFLTENGFLQATVDSIFYESNKKQLKVEITQNQFFYLEKITIEGLPPEIEKKSGLQEIQNQRKTPFSQTEIEEKIKFSLDYFQNHAYPFAKFTQTDFHFSNKSKDSIGINISYQFTQNQKVTIDSIIIKGKIKENPKFVKQLLQLKKNAEFRQNTINNIPKILNNSIYFQNTKPVLVQFPTADKARLIISTQNKKSNIFDGILGVQAPPDDSSKISVTAQIHLKLVSPFKTGKIIDLNFQRLQFGTQILDLKYIHPRFFGLNLQPELQLYLQKQDSSFSNRRFNLSVFYRLNQFLEMNFYYKDKKTSLLSAKKYETYTTAPPEIDSKTKNYGIGIRFNNLDYVQNPRKGFYILTNFGLGNRQISTNPILQEQIYDNLELKSTVQEFESDISWFIPFFSRHVIKIRSFVQYLKQPQYFQNDLFQVGGFNDLRGFPENYFYANTTTMLSLEYRFILDQNANAFTFFDYAYLEDFSKNPAQFQTPFGFGLGIQFQTKAGIMKVIYALGKTKETNIQPNKAQVHVGLVNYF